MAGSEPSVASRQPAAGAVHVWFVDLGAITTETDLEPLLSRTERARARRYQRPGPRSVYVRTHGVLRRFLGAYTGQAPEALRIETTDPGKPFLPDHPLAFSLAHSGSLAAFAFARSVPVGIDIEVLRPRPRLQALAQRTLDPAEYGQWQEIAQGPGAAEDAGRPGTGAEGSPDQANDLQPEAGADPALADFLRRWCRREAVVKATGEGVWAAAPFAILDRPDGTLEIRGTERDWTGWTVLDLEPPTGYVGALATGHPDPTVRARTVTGTPGPSSLRLCRLDGQP